MIAALAGIAAKAAASPIPADQISVSQRSAVTTGGINFGTSAVNNTGMYIAGAAVLIALVLIFKR